MNLSKKEKYLSEEGKWKKIENIITDYLSTPTFYVVMLNSAPALTLLPIGEKLFQTEDELEVANQFYGFHNRLSVFDREKNDTLKNLQKVKEKSENYILKNLDKLNEIESSPINEQYANILMANLHEINPEMELVELYNFYTDKMVEIKLKKNFSAQKNAEIYYRKAKNQHLEIDKLKSNIEHKQNELSVIESHIFNIEKIENFKDLRKYLKENNINVTEENSAGSESLFKNYQFLDFDILVGRNAKNNDLLIQKHAHKDDIWLHAKDVKGSHVIIKNKPGKKIPEVVIEKAAQLAAYFSKRKNDSLCPVIYTPKKFVRKAKGLAEGQVIVEKENVIMVAPENWN